MPLPASRAASVTGAAVLLSQAETTASVTLFLRILLPACRYAALLMPTVPDDVATLLHWGLQQLLMRAPGNPRVHEVVRLTRWDCVTWAKS
jgi:hypothetical protein